MNTVITNITNTPRATVAPIFQGRTIHLIDIENLCGESRPTTNQVRAARRRYLSAVRCSSNDHFVVASSSGNAWSSSSGWPIARYMVRDGKDGADLCLAEVIATEGLEQRFSTAIVASGDGGLAPWIAQLAESGMETVVVSLRDHLSRKMRMAAHKCVVLTPELEEIA